MGFAFAGVDEVLAAKNNKKKNADGYGTGWNTNTGILSVKIAPPVLSPGTSIPSWIL